MAKLRAARAEEAGELSALVLRSKAYWGYDERFLAGCAEELRVRAEEVAARRIVVAEDADGTVRGLASLEGEPAGPVSRLGLLFVDPSAIGRGIGRLLYRDVVRRSVALGTRRLLIDADPHAAGFYRAMGAVAGTGAPQGLVRFEVAPVPLADWAREWTGGRPSVHVGNVAEFNAQFGDPSLDREQRAAHHYACLAAFYGPEPAALVLPLAVSPGWTRLVARQLEWGEVEVYDGLAAGRPGLSDAVRSRPALAARLTEGAPTLVPWGLTEPFGRLSGRPWRARDLRYESKSAAHALFGRILAAGGHPGIRLPGQWRAAGRRQAVRLLSARVARGESSVLKSEHGVGGSGTTHASPERVRAAGGARALVRGLPRGPLLVEEYVSGPAGADGAGDLTYDGFVDGSGRVHTVGGAVMDIVDGGYRGATVGPGVVPAAAERPLSRFGEAVGQELAAAGYRGWFDVDFVVDGTGLLAPTETNLRLTGPSIAFMVAARLDALRGAGHLVRIVDRVELGARLPPARADEWCADLARGCADLGAVFVPAIPTGAGDPAPWLGVLVAARDRAVLDAAEALVRAEALGVGKVMGFDDPDGPPPGPGRAAGADADPSGPAVRAVSAGRWISRRSRRPRPASG
ncbi:GNAT family N-acetyltransferase [Streptomyces sp. NBC_01426]|uniref:GNAT family N-acetyltransferase n=1 Tax=Streptomyces sp. NBC_01426 TaxID=2975866 RepID=UPI002E366059|nr:GNAT family N-acetyltransferase [Streptomyces sp. NBC_01426]